MAEKKKTSKRLSLNDASLISFVVRHQSASEDEVQVASSLASDSFRPAVEAAAALLKKKQKPSKKLGEQTAASLAEFYSRDE